MNNLIEDITQCCMYVYYFRKPQRLDFDHDNQFSICAQLNCSYINILTQQKTEQESPQIVGLRPPMCSQIVYMVNFNANQLNILVHLQLL